MKEIAITADKAYGSVLALAEGIKSMERCFITVLCVDSKAARILSVSKLIDSVCYLKCEDEDSYIKEIQEWYKSKRFQTKPILYFSTDNSCFYIDNNRDWFDEKFELCLPSSEIIQIYTKKGLAEQYAKQAGLDVPETKIISTVDDITYVINEFSFPVVIKPLASYLRDGLNFKIKVFNKKDDFNQTCSALLQQNSFLCQEFIPGGDNVSYYYLFYRSRSGDIYENIGKKILQSSPEGGIMAKGLTEYNHNLSIQSKKFLNEIDYFGIGGIEYKLYNGKFYFIEMSVRLEGFYKITEAAGIPLSLISFYDLSQKEECLNDFSQIHQTDKIIYIDFVTIFFRRIIHHEYLKFFRDLVAMIFNSEYKLNVYSRIDCKPFFMQFYVLLFSKLHKLIYSEKDN